MDNRLGGRRREIRNATPLSQKWSRRRSCKPTRRPADPRRDPIDVLYVLLKSTFVCSCLLSLGLIHCPPAQLMALQKLTMHD
jgi:hypothetical protein